MKFNNSVLFVLNEKSSFNNNGLPSVEWMEFPDVLTKHGINIQIFQPYFKEVEKSRLKLEELHSEFQVQVYQNSFSGKFYKASLTPQIEVIFVKSNELEIKKNEFCGMTSDSDMVINYLSFFSHSVFAYLKLEKYAPSAIHCYGWESGLVPALYRNNYSHEHDIPKIKILFSCNNFYCQGKFDTTLFPLTGLPLSSFNLHELEFWGDFSLLKSGIVYSDSVFIFGYDQVNNFFNDDYSNGLGGVISTFRSKIYGLPAGVNYNKWDPSKDEHIKYKYSKKSYTTKEDNKKDLIKSLKCNFNDKNLTLVTILGGLHPYRNDENINNMIEVMLSLEANFLILGEGSKEIFKNLNQIKKDREHNITLHEHYTEGNLHKILAGSDILLLPSSISDYPFAGYYALSYGTIPIVSEKIGFSLNIQNYNRNYKVGNGFVVFNNRIISVIGVLISALNAINYEGHHKSLINNCMKTKILWKIAVDRYLKIIKTSK